jgi:CubicO group peptidase (beta-lactamase class C family)
MSLKSGWDRVIEAMAEHHQKNAANMPGAVFAAETKSDGRFINSVGPGWSSDTICEIGSMTKPFISAAVLLALEERDMLDIDAPVWRLPGMDLWSGHPVKAHITLRHVLQHTSGLPHFKKYSEWPETRCNNPTGPPPSCADPHLDLGPTTPWIGAPGLTNECMCGGDCCRPARLLDLDHVSRYIMETYPVTDTPPPGTQYSYSTVNYIVAARIVEQLTGRSVNTYIKEKLFAPLDMRNSFFIAQPAGVPAVDAWLDEGTTAEQRARVADVTLITRDGQLPVEVAPGPDNRLDRLRRGWRFVNADGGMYSTASDLLNFLSMLSAGGLFRSRRVLSPRIVRLLVEDQGHAHTMGFGFRGRPTPYGQTAGTVEHMGFKMTYFWLEPRRDDPLTGVFLSQRLPNVAVNTNLGDGMHVMFSVFVPLVGAALSKTELQQPA